MDTVLIRLVDTCFNRMFSDDHCRNIGPTGGYSFKKAPNTVTETKDA